MFAGKRRLWVRVGCSVLLLAFCQSVAWHTRVDAQELRPTTETKTFHSMELLVWDGQDYRERAAELRGSEFVVSLRGGERIAVRLINRTSAPALVQLTVDGVSAFQFSDSPSGLVHVEPNDDVTVTGWIRDRSHADAFVAARAPVAAGKESFRVTGTIKAMFMSQTASGRTPDDIPGEVMAAPKNLIRGPLTSADIRWAENQPGALQHASLIRYEIAPSSPARQVLTELVRTVIETAPTIAASDAVELLERAITTVEQGEVAPADKQELLRQLRSQQKYCRAGAKYFAGEFEDALELYLEALEYNQDNASAANDLAWLRATCSDPAVRDGAESLNYARHACILMDWNNPYFLDTLAAAYAEAGEFELAVAFQEQALGRPDFPENLRDLATERLAEYRAGRPWRQLTDGSIDVSSLPDGVVMQRVEANKVEYLGWLDMSLNDRGQWVVADAEARGLYLPLLKEDARYWWEELERINEPRVVLNLTRGLIEREATIFEFFCVIRDADEQNGATAMKYFDYKRSKVAEKP